MPPSRKFWSVAEPNKAGGWRKASGRIAERNWPLDEPKLRTSTTSRPTPRRAPAQAESGQNERVSLPRLAWLATVAGFVIAALLLLGNGYLGYFLVLLSVAFAAAVNLLR